MAAPLGPFRFHLQWGDPRELAVALGTCPGNSDVLGVVAPSV